MTFYIRGIAFLTSFLYSLFFTLYGQTPQPNLIMGTWEFEKFEFSGQIANVPLTEQKKANETNKGLIIKFDISNRFSSQQKGDKAKENANGTYKLLPKNKLVFMGDTVTIIQLDKFFLKLYRDELSPLILFKRK